MASIFKNLNFNALFASHPSDSFEEPIYPISHKRHVVFSERVKVVEIPSAKLLTQKDKKALWYSEPGESAGKRSRARLLLCAIEDHRDDSSESEHEEDQAFERPEDRRKLPISAVLVEQKHQRVSGIEDSVFIAKIYKQCSAHATMKAQIRAMQDEEEAEENIWQQKVVPDGNRKTYFKGY
eukprot:CAMPEP_0168209280 /NCGR_PEP_ID=MMETSP0140_2-20121125/2524_1 /TAXON_ID=44445 /ORGANISM="Pseudo-nitzschia australis, Strain 10249 10 AB" /LENGTH=180 /DNA_ID=CAMNT_0008135747 /DNA_START=178 /DNA_END=721 /DNA_ORIENTATION=+